MLTTGSGELLSPTNKGKKKLLKKVLPLWVGVSAPARFFGTGTVIN